MYRITKIRLKNFRSIRGEEIINLTESGQNLLIYGENGSGKSTICLALHTFFETADQRRKIDLKSMAHIYLPKQEKEEVAIEITLIDKHPNRPPTWKTPENFAYTINGHSADRARLEILRDANRFKGHLDYRNLLKTYLIEAKALNLFSLIVEKIFNRTTIPGSKKLFGLEWERISGVKQAGLSDREKIIAKKDREKFNSSLKNILERIEPDVNRLLQRFDPLMSVNLIFSGIYLEKGIFGRDKITLEVKYNNQKIVQHQDFFNEARLSALGISLYLASFLYHKNESEYQNAFKLLLLDDIFIGMDMGNRIPLLKILNEDFGDYQIIMTTYDQHWFNTAQFYLSSGKWKQLKFYVNNTDVIGQYSTKIIDETDEPKQLAKKYFDLKDYQACANYQRKALERQLKSLLPEYLQKELDNRGNIVPAGKLATVYSRLLQWLKEAGFSVSCLEDFSLYAKVVLNPLSHDNSDSPIFRQELDSVFQILANLEEIRPSVLIHAKEGACLFASYHDSRSNEERHYKVILTESLWRIEWKDKVGYPPCLCRLVGSKGEDSDWIDQSRNADQFIQKTHTELQKKHRINPYRPFEEVYRDHEKTLIKSLKIEL